MQGEVPQVPAAMPWNCDQNNPSPLGCFVKCLITARRKVTNTEEEVKFQNLEQTSYWDLDRLSEMSDWAISVCVVSSALVDSDRPLRASRLPLHTLTRSSTRGGLCREKGAWEALSANAFVTSGSWFHIGELDHQPREHEEKAVWLQGRAGTRKKKQTQKEGGMKPSWQTPRSGQNSPGLSTICLELWHSPYKSYATILRPSSSAWELPLGILK